MGNLHIVGKFAHCGEKVDFCGEKKIDHFFAVLGEAAAAAAALADRQGSCVGNGLKIIKHLSWSNYRCRSLIGRVNDHERTKLVAPGGSKVAGRRRPADAALHFSCLQASE